MNEMGDAELQACITYIDESAQSTGNRKEDQIGRGIIQEGGQQAGHPEHLPGLIQTQRCAVGIQEQQCGDHGDKDTDEQNRNLFNCAPGKGILGANFLLGGLEGQECCDQNDNQFDNVGVGQADITKDVDA